MRNKIKELNRNKKYKFSATVTKIHYESIMLTDVYLVMDNSYLTDHLWIRANKKTDNLNLKTGDKITFTGVVRDYMKITRESDYGISNITNMSVIGKESQPHKKLDFSIIIPYRGEKDIYIQRCLNSIRQQSRIKEGKRNKECAEVFVINTLDSSIPKQIKQDYSDICTFIDIDSNDYYQAILKGYKESKGKILLFMNPQDSLENEALKEIYSITRSNSPYVTIFNDSYEALNDGSIEMLDEDKKEQFLKQCDGHLSSKAFALNAFNALGLPNVSEDTIALEILKHVPASNICVYHKKLYSK